jgi:hypothetical protein
MYTIFREIHLINDKTDIYNTCVCVDIYNTCVCVDDTAWIVKLKTPLWLSTHFMDGKCGWKTNSRIIQLSVIYIICSVSLIKLTHLVRIFFFNSLNFLPLGSTLPYPPIEDQLYLYISEFTLPKNPICKVWFHLVMKSCIHRLQCEKINNRRLMDATRNQKLT